MYATATYRAVTQTGMDSFWHSFLAAVVHKRHVSSIHIVIYTTDQASVTNKMMIVLFLFINKAM